jgi:hypothetical protein
MSNRTRIVDDPDLVRRCNRVVESVPRYDPNDSRERTRNHLRLLAKGLLDEVGRGYEPGEFKGFVGIWCNGPLGEAIKFPSHLWKWFVDYYEKTHTVRGEGLARAYAAVDDPSLSDGFPQVVLDDPDANRLARLFRWLNRYHRQYGREVFRLPYRDMLPVLSITAPSQAQRRAYRLILAGLVDSTYRGTPPTKGLARKDMKSTEWVYLGPP